MTRVFKILIMCIRVLFRFPHHKIMWNFFLCLTSTLIEVKVNKTFFMKISDTDPFKLGET